VAGGTGITGITPRLAWRQLESGPDSIASVECRDGCGKVLLAGEADSVRYEQKSLYFEIGPPNWSDR
jgi:hypothetical protein